MRLLYMLALCVIPDVKGGQLRPAYYLLVCFTMQHVCSIYNHANLMHPSIRESDIVRYPHVPAFMMSSRVVINRATQVVAESIVCSICALPQRSCNTALATARPITCDGRD